MTLTISSAFDSGNIEVRSLESSQDIRLGIVKDAESDFLQWFHFRLGGAFNQTCSLSIENAGETTYPAGWKGYNVVASYDRKDWFRIPSEFDGSALTWSVTPKHDAMYFAYFAPYSLERHYDLIARMAVKTGVRSEQLGLTLDGRPLDCLHFEQLLLTKEATRPQVWAIARQHPGESMAEWWMEGWLDRLVDPDDSTARALRQLADLHVVPNMNPDGTARGHLRCNAVGANLNREWAEPSLLTSPEVHQVKQRMLQTGVNLSLDVHGDEALPYNFIAGTEGIEGWNEARDNELKAFKHTLSSLNPDFQCVHGYPRNRPGAANLTFCSNQLAHRFGALAVTLEMPFKDTADSPRPTVGWSPERCRQLGATFVDATYLALTHGLLPDR